MRGIRIGILVTAALVVGGCAQGKYGQQMTRLQSQVGLLDERVTQLERASAEGIAAVAPVIEPLTDIASAPAVPLSLEPTRAGSAEHTSSKPAAKPTARAIQQALKNAGFYQGAVDGRMGPLTRDAIREFQRVHGLVDDGVVGKRTWAKLHEYATLSAGSGELSAAESIK